LIVFICFVTATIKFVFGSLSIP